MADMIGILNTIRANASTEYQDRIPVAERTNIAAVGDPILTYQIMQNEFLSALVNKIAFAVIRNQTATNPLAVLKKGTVPLGTDIQEIFTNMAKDQGLDWKGDKLLTKTTPDTKTLFHRLSREGQYAATITRPMLQRAFTSYSELEVMMTSIINSLYSGDNMDEFILMKNVFAGAVSDTKIITCAVDHIKDEATGKAFIKAVKKASKAFTFPSHAFNTYYANKPAGDAGAPVTTWTPLTDQVLVVRADVMVDIDVDVLAAAFNMGKVEFLAHVLEVDSFGAADNCLAVLCDRSFVQVYDNLYEMTEFYNPQGLYWNYWLNHVQTYSFSLFANAIAFVCDDEAISLDQATLTFANKDAATQTLTATTTPADATVDWITSNAAVATVSDAGVVDPQGKGTCVISAINGDQTANCAVTVTA